MKKQHICILLVFALLLCLPLTSVSASTTFKDVTINTDRTGLELGYTTDAEHTLILWEIREVQDSEVKLANSIAQRYLEKTTETTDSYLIQYLIANNRFYVKIESDTSAITVTVYMNNYGIKYADSTLQLFYVIDGTGATLNFTQVALNNHQCSLTLSKAQTPLGGISIQYGVLWLYTVGWWIFFAVWLVISVVLALWVYRDAQKRTCGKEGLLWLIIVLVAGVIGLLIYWVVRKDLKCRR